jgi:hypothetical protein
MAGCCCRAACPRRSCPSCLADSKWGRCAAIKAGAVSDQGLPVSHGIGIRRCSWSFWPTGFPVSGKGEEYAHGGLSLQEVRKDLVRTFSRQFPVPTYVVEFLLGRYCASTDEEEIEEGWRSSSASCATARSRRARRSCSRRGRARRAGQDHRPHHGPAGRQDRLLPGHAAQPAPERCAHQTELVKEHERMLTGGFYAEIDLDYDAGHRPGERTAGRSASIPARDPALQARCAG